MWNRWTINRAGRGRVLAAAVAALALVQTVPGRAGDTSEGDRKALLAHLERTEKMFLASIEGLTEAQWKWKAGPDRWSAAEVAEHITTSEGALRGLVTDQVMKAPAPADMLEKTKGKDSLILQAIPDRTRRAQAPEMLQPKGRWPTVGATVAAFKEERAKTAGVAKDPGKDLRAFAGPNPALKELDAYQWLLFISAHTERHTKQIEEVKAAAGFPK